MAKNEEENLKRKENAEERIKQLKNQALKDIKNTSVKIALESVEKLIKNSLDKSKLDKIYASSIEETKLAWQSLLTARERLELLENAVNIATEVFGSRKKLREAGKETVINVLDAENEVNNAQTNFNSATYDERLAVYSLIRAMGQLTKTSLALDN